ncbi:MAG: VPLPA-CTERM sorting domain-containing protein [Thermodesulfobacteriota bacterium]|nr:VPLPA-CTERM sorting domain-containing protein [Thermodesulfobacteriota bacterium]
MTKQIKFGLLTLITFLFLSGQALAGPVGLTITDVYQNDLNIILNQTPGPVSLIVDEDYNETYLTPYPSHDGLAIVNAEGNYFDKVVMGYDLGAPLDITFNVHNSGPYVWSDYHFEFWNADFTEQLGGIVMEWAPATIFQNSQYDGLVLEFWAPGWQHYCEIQTFSMFLNPLGIESFGIRQVATTAVPIPGVVWLLGSGLIGLVGLRRKLKS